MSIPVKSLSLTPETHNVTNTDIQYTHIYSAYIVLPTPRNTFANTTSILPKWQEQCPGCQNHAVEKGKRRKHSWHYEAERKMREGAVKHAYVEPTRNTYQGTFCIVDTHTHILSQTGCLDITGTAIINLGEKAKQLNNIHCGVLFGIKFTQEDDHISPFWSVMDRC